MKKEKPKKIYELIAEVLREEVTFDLEDNPNNYTSIWWLIAECILQKYKFPSGYKPDLKYYTKKVEHNFRYVKKMLEETYNIPVYKGPKDSRKILFITLDKDYRNASEQDEIRGNIRVSIVLDAWGRECKTKGYIGLPSGQARKAITGETEQKDVA